MICSPMGSCDENCAIRRQKSLAKRIQTVPREFSCRTYVKNIRSLGIKKFGEYGKYGKIWKFGKYAKSFY